MKYFLQLFCPFRSFKKGSCQFLAKEFAQYWIIHLKMYVPGGGLVKGKYLMIILGQFSPSFHKSVYCGYSLEVPQ